MRSNARPNAEPIRYSVGRACMSGRKPILLRSRLEIASPTCLTHSLHIPLSFSLHDCFDCLLELPFNPSCKSFIFATGFRKLLAFWIKLEASVFIPSWAQSSTLLLYDRRLGSWCLPCSLVSTVRTCHRRQSDAISSSAFVRILGLERSRDEDGDCTAVSLLFANAALLFTDMYTLLCS